jgi:hypothetical protein
MTASPDLPNPDHVLRIAQELSLKVHQVAATAQLIKEGATVPFIARYRKEVTGELDEVAVLAIRVASPSWARSRSAAFSRRNSRARSTPPPR